MKRRYLFFVITLLFVLLFSVNCNAKTDYYQTQTPIQVYEGDEIRLIAYLPNSIPYIDHSEFLIDTGSGYSSSKPASYITLNGNYRFEEMEKSKIFNKCIYTGGNLNLSISRSGTYKVKGATWGYYQDTAHGDGSRVSHNLGIYEWTIIVEKKYVEPTPIPSPTTNFIIKSGNNDVTGKKITLDLNNTDQIQLSGVPTPSDAVKTFKWVSQYTNVADVGASSGLVTGKSKGTTRITATTTDGTNISKWVDVQITNPAATGITIKNNNTDVTGKTITLDLNKSTTLQLIAAVSPAKAYQKVSWSSSKPEVASVDANTGLVTGKQLGTTTITATAKDGSGVTAQMKIKIPGATSVSILSNGKDVTGKTLELNPNETDRIQLSASSEPAAALQKFKWSVTGGTAVGYVSENGGLVTWYGTKSGTMTVRATTEDGSGKYAVVKILVPPVTEVRITYRPTGVIPLETAEIDMSKQETLQLYATAEPEEAYQKFTWKSSDTSIATVNSETGLITAQRAGKTKITATANDGSGKSATILLTVIQPTKELNIQRNDIKAKVDKRTVTVFLESGTFSFSAYASPSNAIQNFNWYTGNSNIATVDKTGTVTLKKTGKVRITVRTKDDTYLSSWVDLDIREANRESSSLYSVKYLDYPLDPYDPDPNNIAWELTIHPGFYVDAKRAQDIPWFDNRYYCTKVTIEDGVTEIGNYYFSGMNAVKEIIVPDSVLFIGDYAFQWCNIAQNVITKNVRKIGADAFDDATFQFSSLTLPDGLEVIGSGAFLDGWDSKLSSITVPSTVYSITGNPFKANDTPRAEKNSYAAKWLIDKGLPVTQFDTDPAKLTTSLKIKDKTGKDVTGKTITIDMDTATKLQLTPVFEPAAASQDILWTSSNMKVAPVYSSCGLVVALQGGEAKITASTKDGSGKKAVVTIKVVPPKTTSISLFFSGNDFSGDCTNKTVTIHKDILVNILQAKAEPPAASQEFTWKSSDNSIIGITDYSSYAYLNPKKPGTATITVTATDGTKQSVWMKLKYEPLAESVKIQNSSGSDITGKTVTVKSASYQLKAVATPEGVAQKFTWVSSSTGIATVDANGMVTFKKAGTVKITATASDGSKEVASVTLKYVPLATAVKIQNSSGTDITGKTVTVNEAYNLLKAVASPTGAAQKFTWTSGNTSIATVDEDGWVAFKKVGSVKITATASDGSKKAASITLKYTPLATSVKIQNSSGTDITGKSVTISSASYQLKAVATPTGATQKFTWASGSTGIAMVDANGKVTFKKAGSVKITATASDGSKEAASVTLKYTPLTTAVKMQNSSGADITGKTVTVTSASYQLKAVATPGGAAQKFTWTSGSTGIATVDANGKVTFKKAGSVKITATASDGSKKAASVTLKYSPQKPVLEIKDTNIRGKNKEVQIVVPWTSDLINVECTLYDDSTGKEVKPTFRERMDSTGKNKVVSYVGAPLTNGNVYRFKLRVYNGQWSNYVEKYAMPISNVYGATVVAGNKTMYINTQHREPATGTRYMVFDAATQKELAYKAGTKTDTTWKYEKLTNGKLYYVVAVPYRDYKGQRLWGPNENRIYFIPMGIPGSGKVSFSGTNATVSIAADSSVDGIRVLYRTVGGALKNGCEAKGAKCTIKGLNSGTAYEFYAMKYKIAQGKTYYSTGTLIPYKTTASGLTAPQMNPVVAMNNSGYTTFTIKKSSNAEGISVLYKIGTGNFVQACEKAGNSCSTTLDISKNYTFYIMQYKTVNGKKVYSPGIVARDYTSGKAPDAERLYMGFTLADGIIDMNEVYDALDGYASEESLLLTEALAVMGEDLVSKNADAFEADTFYEDEDFDYSDFDSDEPYGEYEAEDSDSYDPDDAVYEPYDESGAGIDWENGPETGMEEPLDEGDGSEESEDLYMYYFGNGEKPLPPAPSFNNL